MSIIVIFWKGFLLDFEAWLWKFAFIEPGSKTGCEQCHS